MIRKWGHQLLSFTGFALISVEERKLLRQSLFGRFWLENLFSDAGAISGRKVPLIDLWIEHSQSQLGQDLVALGIFGPERQGFFVEFGATNGMSLSNTWLLEKKFGWNGIVCEPATRWRSELVKNRSCAIDLRCVYNRSGERIKFSETKVGELSTISEYSDQDMHATSRLNSKDYFVDTVSLFDLLIQHQAPKFIEFLSIDTEGSEFEILDGFEFSEFKFGLICVEHNYSPQREKIKNLLETKGYRQVLNKYSKFDDWFTHQDLQELI
jgi:FkbM family methyltransferase